MMFKKERSLIILLALFSALMVCVFSSRLTSLGDWSFFTEYSYRFSLNQRPYLDFGLTLTPGTFLVQGLLIKIFGVNYYVQTAFVALEAAISVVLTGLILKEITKEYRFIAYILIPLIYLAPGVQAPFPDYDNDACIASLLSIYLFIKAFNKNDRYLYLSAGLSSVFVFFFKQTIGAGVIAGMTFSSFFIDPKKGLSVLSGIFIGFVCFALAIIMMSGPEGLAGITSWIFIHAHETRGKDAITFVVSTLKMPVAYLYAASWLLSWFILKKGQNRRSVVLAFCFFILPYVPANFFALSSNLHEMRKYFAYLWPAMFVTAGILYAFEFVKTRTISSGVLIFIICTITSLATFASHGLFVSTYGIWPLFFLVWTGLFKDFFPSKKLVLIFTLLLLLPAGIFVQSNMLFKTIVPSKLESHSASFEGIKGLTTSGPWIYNFERLLEWTEANIPHNDRIISLPGEDPFHSVTGRYPHLSVFSLIPGAFPFDLVWLEKEIRSKKIQWIVLKTDLQLPRAYLKTDRMMNNLKRDFSLVQTLTGYEIYKTKDYTKTDVKTAEQIRD